MWSALGQYLVQGWHGSVLEETLEKVPSAQGSQGDDIRATALAGEEQRLQEGQHRLQEVRGCGGQVSSPPHGNCCQVQRQAQLSQSLARDTLLGESPPFPGGPEVNAARASVPLRGMSWSDSPATKPKPCWQGWFSTQVWQLMSEQCMPARHWHTVLCVAFPCVFKMRPASGQREHGRGEAPGR